MMPTTSPTATADLHAHTTASDGTSTPTELVQTALAAGLRYLAVTDHDTTNGIAEALEAAKGTGLQIISGVELSAEGSVAEGGKSHLLGLGIDYAHPELVETLASISFHRRQRNLKMAERLQSMGIDITLDEIVAIAPDGANIGRPHFAQALVARGIVPDIKAAFDRYLADNGSAYVARVSLNAQDCIRLIHNAGGLCFLAHPAFLRLAAHETFETRIALLQSYGMDGIEAYYSSFSPAETEQFVRMAQKRNLLVTGGSDFHGANKPYIRLGGVINGGPLSASLLPPQLLAKSKPGEAL